MYKLLPLTVDGLIGVILILRCVPALYDSVFVAIEVIYNT